MNRRGLTVVAAASAVLLSACSSSTSGTPTDSGSTGSAAAPAGSSSSGSAPSSSAPSTSASSSSASSSGNANTPQALATILREGLAATTSAHITLRVTTGGQAITGSGDEKISGGRLSALDLTETIPSVGSLRIIQVNGKTYVKQPMTRNPAKPWSLVTSSSSDPAIRSLATTLQTSQSTATDSATTFAAAARSVADRGRTTVAGVPATHYAIVVDVAKLPTNYAGRSALAQAGITTLPIDLYLDAEGRPVQVTEQLTVSGTTVSTVAGVTRYNEPVTITAPPANQISTS